MVEIRIHGRGGQGGVTLAKILATANHILGKSVQAFGIYAAERSGAPLQAFLRADDEAITNRNLIYEPDHLIVLDPTLVPLGITNGLKPGGFILINSPEPPEFFVKEYSWTSFSVATVDARGIALDHDLGTKSLPIVNTALTGATAKLFNLSLETVEKALDQMGFHGGNLDAAKAAYEAVKVVVAVGTEKGEGEAKPLPTPARIPGPMTADMGSFPKIRTGNWATQQPLRNESTPPCNFICPAGNDVQGFLARLAKEDVQGALEILLETSPFPSVCGRVCPGFCMQQCNRMALDEPVNVRALERYVGDFGEFQAKKSSENRPQSVAVIGGGPAGLSSAYHLAKMGYGVTIFEAENKLGGLLRTGIPEYRLPRESLDRDIQRVLDLGVHVRAGRRLSTEDLSALSEEYDAVIGATGLQSAMSLDLGSDAQNVMQGIEFLDLARNRSVDVKGQRVVITGGGNTAVDAARSALRLGAKTVQIIYRRTHEEMPAIPEEIDEAIDEGIEIRFLVSPLKIEKRSGDYFLQCQKMKLGEEDSSGRPRPIPIEGSEFELECDRVILALGQRQDLSLYGNPKDLVGNQEEDFQAAGDLLTNEGTVAAAIGCGRDTAFRLHQQFTGENLLSRTSEEESVIRAEKIKLHQFATSHKHQGEELKVSRRVSSFEEVRGSLDSPQEAQRCLSCGVCNSCDRCVTYCPDGVLKRINGELVFDYDYCKGCGVCATECSRTVIFMRDPDEARKAGDAK